MSKGRSGGRALSGLMFATVVGMLGLGGAWWAYKTYEYGEQRLEVRKRVLETSDDWSPSRMVRSDSTEDCDAAKLREEAELLLEEVSPFDRGKVERFHTSPTDQRARELANTVKAMQPAVDAFLQAYSCSENGRLPRTGLEKQLSGPLLVRGIMVAGWLDPTKAGDLRRALWIGRDVQVTTGLYEFMEGVQIMNGAYIGLSRMLTKGSLDEQLPGLLEQLQALAANTDSAQLHWRAGARILLADLLGPDWEASPPTPLQAGDMLAAMDEVIASLDGMPDIAEKPYPERRADMTQWVADHDMSTWNQKFRGFGKAGVVADDLSTLVDARNHALIIGIGLRMYKQKRGSCPRELEDLVTDGYLTAIPLDPLANAPFTYDRATCTVTSVPAPLDDVAVTVSAI